jgi:radical SAM superfamily enzyme YgiQ (UPF0313 family)
VKVLLLYPEFPDTFWSFKHALKFIQKKASLPPLGLLTVASMLPKTWDKRLVDLNVRHLRSKDIKWADAVFISAMIAQQSSVKDLIARCKAAGKKIIAGGPLFTSGHEQFPDVDHFVLNEGELTLPDFIRDFEQGCAKPLYSAEGFADVQTTPIPSWELADLKRYATMSLQFSRGCPFDCEFCDVTAKFGHRPRVKTSVQVIAELEALYQRGWRGQVFFVDDNLIGNKHALKTDLLPALISWRKNHKGMPFFTEASINLADDAELMNLMTQAGFDCVFIGIETPADVGLAECNKKQNRGRDLVECVKTIQRAGLEVQGGFIVGFDSDEPNIFRRQVEFIQKSGIVTAMVGILNALPDTRLYARMKTEGRLLGLSSGDNVDGTTNFVPRMNIDALKEGYRSILEHIYTPAPYYRRIKTFLREYKRPKISAPMGWHHFNALVLSMVRLGVLGRERFQYWRLLCWTLFHRPRMLPMAVTMAIYGHHFRKCCLSIEARARV